MIPKPIEFDANGFRLGKLGVGVAFLRDELTAHFGSGQSGIKPVVAKLRIGLALSVHNRLDVGQ